MTTLINSMIPPWASPYFSIAGNLLYFLQTQIDDTKQDSDHIYWTNIAPVLDKEKRIFDTAYKTLKTKCVQIARNNVSKVEIIDYVREYMFCQIALGINRRSLALLEKRNYRVEGNHKKAKGVNDGTKRQHWIPRLYMDDFLTSQFIRVPFKSSSNHIPLYGPIRLNNSDYKSFGGKLVGYKSPEFCETQKNSGKFYDPWFELVLARFETDYGEIKAQKHSHSLWYFIVMASFFMIFNLRTAEKAITRPEGWSTKEGYLIDYLPNIISQLDLIIIDTRIWDGPSTVLPFCPHPVLVTEFKPSEYCMWAIRSASELLWFYNTSYTNTIPDYSICMSTIMNILNQNTEGGLYFPKDSAYWTFKAISEFGA